MSINLQVAINKEYLGALLECLSKGLEAEPHVATNVCLAFIGLSDAAYKAAKAANSQGSTPQTYCLSPYFEIIIKQLLETTERSDGAHTNLHDAAYKALKKMIKNSPLDCYVVVQRTIIVILERINQVLQMETHTSSYNDRLRINDLQLLLWVTLKKVHKEDAPQISDAIMNTMITMFRSSAVKTGTVQEDAFFIVTTLAKLLGNNFLKYMEAFKPFLYMGLKNVQEYEVWVAAVILTGVIFRALKHLILPYCDEIMTLLLSNLTEANLHCNVKPLILGFLGDVAMTIKGRFLKYLNVVLEILRDASELQVDSSSNYDMVEYLHQMRESILEAYTSIIQGLRDAEQEPNPDIMHIEPHLPNIIGFIKRLAIEGGGTDKIVSYAAGLIGDLCTTFGSRLSSLIDDETIAHFLIEGKRSKDSRTRSLSNWALKEVEKIRPRKVRRISCIF